MKKSLLTVFLLLFIVYYPYNSYSYGYNYGYQYYPHTLSPNGTWYGYRHIQPRIQPPAYVYPPGYRLRTIYPLYRYPTPIYIVPLQPSK